MNLREADPYDPQRNPLSPGNIRKAYLDCGSAVASGATYSALVLEQQPIDPSDLDAGLAVKLEAYRQNLASQAQYHSRIRLDFISACSRAANFAALLNAFSGPNQALIKESARDPASRREVAELIGTLADEAGQTLLGLGDLDTHLTTLETALARTDAPYDETVSEAIAQLGKEAGTIQAEIDRLTKAISDGIDQIVKGANETGGAVADLFIGIIAQFDKNGAPVPDGPKKKPGAEPDTPKADTPKADTPKADDPKVKAPDSGSSGDKAAAPMAADAPRADTAKDDAQTDAPKPDAAKPDAPKSGGAATTPAKDDQKPTSADFVVKAIEASSKGMDKYSTAIGNLKLDNAALASAYMHLARLDPLVAVAKSAQAQKNLFVTAVTRTRAALTGIDAEWQTLRKRLGETSRAAEALGQPDEARALAALAAAGGQMWSGVGRDIDALRSAMTGSGALPVS
ncbi:MAG TPA: hypothetical protein PLL33_12390 [Paracoccus sp. (in: a-proteobacteria)]|nr:hypothetical protein [Paracoccus sp. (in: a-proteobacteria)]